MSKYGIKILCIRCGAVLFEDKTNMDFKDFDVAECLSCNAVYPIIHKIPRLLSGAMLDNCLLYYQKDISSQAELYSIFITKFKSNQIDKEAKVKIDTQNQFGFEWNKWPTLPAFAENHWIEVMDKEDVFFKDKMGWDPAVGMGRDLYNAAKAVGQDGFMIGSDLSFAVDHALERCHEFQNVLIIQGDLYDNFVADESLDFAYMIGLIQHLTKPKEGIKHVLSKVKMEGYFVGTIYTAPEDSVMKLLVWFLNTMRVITTRLPLRIVYYMSKLFALPAYIFFKLPNFVLKHFKYIQSVRSDYPDHDTVNRKPDFDLLTHNWFDHLTPPIIGFYSKEEIRELFNHKQFKKVFDNHGFVRGYKTKNL